MPYTNLVKWALDNANPNKHTFDDHIHIPLASFHLEVFSRAYALGPPRKILSSKFLDETISQFNYEEVVKHWMENPTKYVPRPSDSCLISWFKEPFSFLSAMLCRLYGLENCSLFKAEWVPVAHHILLIGESFNWAHILSLNLKEEIEKY